ncbi:MAG: nitrogenase molybdenum-iron protein [Lachnospiraceae bacterium]|nr:nitrogenase molybdenum-iron protein [Lachnospiraceae bacterium]
MRGLRKYLTPFAPDQSGAVSVLYELGGILVIVDAGGCVGNICGFDEPRWQEKKSAIFSAGLRDMDAIMGRDKELVEKLAGAAEQVEANFVAFIGTPVPSVIGTDYYALSVMTERKIKLPVIAIDTNGMELYDKGASKAYFELGKRFFEYDKDGKVGIIGWNPLDINDAKAVDKLREIYKRALIFGKDDCFEDGNKVKLCENIVISHTGLAAAKYMKEKLGIPYRIEQPLAKQNDLYEIINPGSKVLVVDEQIAGNSIREELEKKDGEVTVASWFGMEESLREKDDVHLQEEDDFCELVESGSFDAIIADAVHRQMIPDFKGLFVEKTSFAISGNREML